MPNDNSGTYPFEHPVIWIAGVVAMGSIAGYVSWALAKVLLPDDVDGPERWALVGGALAGWAALWWVVIRAIVA